MNKMEKIKKSKKMVKMEKSKNKKKNNKIKMGKFKNNNGKLKNWLKLKIKLNKKMNFVLFKMGNMLCLFAMILSLIFYLNMLIKWILKLFKNSKLLAELMKNSKMLFTLFKILATGFLLINIPIINYCLGLMMIKIMNEKEKNQSIKNYYF
jgi:hypothetical protein